MRALDKLAAELEIIVVPSMMTVEEIRPILDTTTRRLLIVAVGKEPLYELMPSLKRRFHNVRGLWVRYRKGVLVLAVNTAEEAFECLANL